MRSRRQGGCGACTVLLTKREPLSRGPVSHRAINACIAPIASLADSAITTIEALGSIREGLHPVVRARIAPKPSTRMS